MRWSARWVLVLLVLLGFSPVVVVPFTSLVQLLLHDGARNRRRMIEHQTTAVVGGGEQHPYPPQGEQQNEEPLRISHSAFPGDPPQSQHSEDAQGNQCELLV